MLKPRISLTVDVEAHPIRAEKDHIERLIWGRQNGREAGIQTMMDIADKHGVKMTFFLDYPEYELYGEELLDVGREIVKRGHDLQPHCHLEYITKPLFGHKDEWALRLPKASLSESEQIIDYLLEKQSLCGGKPPSAYRSGAYLIGPDFLTALKNKGIRLDASYNLLCPENPFKIGLRPRFQWLNGPAEAPIPFIPYFEGHNYLVPWNFNANAFTAGTVEQAISSHSHFLKSWFARHGAESMPALIMHSWSFWKQSPKTGFIDQPLADGIERFDALLEMLVRECDIKAMGDIAACDSIYSSHEIVDPQENEGHCPVCYEPVTHFQNHRLPRRVCPFCGSYDRQRTLVDLVYQGKLGPFAFVGKDVLHIAPVRSEAMLFKRMADCKVTSLDIMPIADIQADLQDMPEIASNSFDVVIACGVFQNVRDLNAALKEIWRVLRQGGLFLISEYMLGHDYTYNIDSHAEQIAFYGQEGFDKYGIGAFRRFGKKDFEKSFQDYFYTRIIKMPDIGTRQEILWLAGAPKRDIACAK